MDHVKRIGIGAALVGAAVLCIVAFFALRFLASFAMTDTLVEAAARGDQAAVRRVLDLGGSPDLHAPNGPTALINAVCEGHVGVVKDLLARGADVTLRDRDGKTALMYATERHDKAMLLLLQAAGARE